MSLIPPFKVDGLLVVVRSLVAKYNLGYEPIDQEPHNAYDLFAEIKRKNHIGKAFLSQRGIEVELFYPVREILIEKGYPVEHPESEASKAGFTDGIEFAGVPSWVVGNFTLQVSDFGFIVLREVV